MLRLADLGRLHHPAGLRSAPRRSGELAAIYLLKTSVTVCLVSHVSGPALMLRFTCDGFITTGDSPQHS